MPLPSKIAVGLTKYIDDSGERPVIRNTNIPVATIAYRALSGSWELCQLGFQFSLDDAPIMAALLYYEQFKKKIDAQEGDFHLEFEALD